MRVFLTVMYCLQSAVEGESQGERHIWHTLQFWKLDIMINVYFIRKNFMAEGEIKKNF